MKNHFERDKVSRLRCVDQLIEPTLITLPSQRLLLVRDRLGQPHQFKHFFLWVDAYFFGHFFPFCFLHLAGFLDALHLAVEHLLVVGGEAFGVAEELQHYLEEKVFLLL